MSDTVLAVFTHPDDCEIASGGTLAKWASEGKTVVLGVLTDGRRGSQNPSEDIEALILTRRRESQAGAVRMGFRDVRFFDSQALVTVMAKSLQRRIANERWQLKTPRGFLDIMSI